jgi:hypothetical protein
VVFLRGQSLQVHGLLSAVLLNGAQADGFDGKPSHVLSHQNQIRTTQVQGQA